MRTLAIAASSSRVSLNRHLQGLLCDRLADAGHEMEVVDYALFDTMAHYNFDVEQAEGLPSQARELAERIEAARALLVTVPEYNHAIPGTLKNGIDWISRVKPSPFLGKYVLAASASPSIVGGWRGMQDLRLPLEALGAMVMPGVVSVGGVRSAADIDARLAEPEVSDRVDGALRAFSHVVTATHEFVRFGEGAARA